MYYVGSTPMSSTSSSATNISNATAAAIGNDRIANPPPGVDAVSSATPDRPKTNTAVADNPPTNPDTGKYYGGYGGGGGGGGSSAKDWASEIKNADVTPQSLLPDSAKNGDLNNDLLKGAGLNKDENGNISADANIGPINNVDVEEEKVLLNQITDAQKQQAELTANNTIATGTRDLQRNQENSQEQFQTQLNAINRDMQRSLDNQVLYNEARGDRGGVGQAQYNSIQNTAATNRLTVQKQQQQLATDTARQIADLRAQGEFEKANNLLSITQNYLSHLMNLQTWAKEANIGIDEFNKQIEEYNNNYKLQLLDAQINVANATGSFSNGTPTYAAYMTAQQQLASSGQALMEAGIAPTVEQLAAMGMTKDQAVAYLKKYYKKG